MLKNETASVVVAQTHNTSLNQPFNYGHQKAQRAFNTNPYSQLNQEEKLRRHSIHRSLISGLRGERFEQNGEFADLIFDLPKLANSKNFGSLHQDQLWKLGVCAVPNFILNALICQQLHKKFGDLSICGCFYKINDCWRLDVDSGLARRGLLLPLRSRFTGLIYALKVFRHPDDPKPFILKLRGGLNG